MKIEVRTPDLKKGLKLFFPNGLMKSRLLWKIAEKCSDTAEGNTVSQYQPLISSCCEALTEYAKAYGHFNLVEVIQLDGTNIIITV